MSATPQLPPVAKLEQKTVVDLIAKGNRIDERGHDSYRPITIQTGVIEKANGSAQIFLGKTRVLVGIKVETGEPFADTPEEGVLTVNAELVPLAHPSFEPGPPDENAIELARVIDRGIRESKAIDLKALCLQRRLRPRPRRKPNRRRLDGSPGSPRKREDRQVRDKRRRGNRQT